MYDVSSIVSLMIPGSTPYTFANTLNVTQGNIQEPLSVDSLNAATKKVYKNDPSPAEFLPENAGITLGGLASPSAGNGTLYIKITYRKLKLDSTF